MTNLKFKAVRKCYGFEWEAFKNLKDDNFIAICHTFSGSVESKTWDGLWEEILKASKDQRKLERQKKRSRR
tara:strand:+ start:91 stop:303 length:213 start_codon:yes stop_codon:yes gene_type:complete